MIEKGSSWHIGLSSQTTPLSLERRTKLLFVSLGKFPFARLCGPQSPWQGMRKLLILRNIKLSISVRTDSFFDFRGIT